MTEDEFLSVIDKASKVVARVYSRKRISDTAGIDKKKVILLFLSLLFAVAFLILIYYAIYYDMMQLEIVAYSFAAAAFAILIPLSLFECLRHSDNKLMIFN
jgi:hypothetical protein